MGYDSGNAGVVTITDPEEVCRDLSLQREELFADPLAYVDRHGEYVGPWPVTLRLAHRVAEVHPELVLDDIRKQEREIEGGHLGQGASVGAEGPTGICASRAICQRTASAATDLCARTHLV